MQGTAAGWSLRGGVWHTPAAFWESEGGVRKRAEATEPRLSVLSPEFPPARPVHGTAAGKSARLGPVQEGSVELAERALSVSAGTGKGATFTVVLPGASEGEASIEFRPGPTSPHRGRVLVVDDNVDAATTLAEAMGMEGHEIRVAHDGPAALQQAREFSPQVVLLDIGLPGMDGYEVLRRLRELPQMRGALLVALTGFGQQRDRQRALAGFDEHLVKPVDLEAIRPKDG